MNNTDMKVVIALVGMPGAGKTEAATYLAKKGIPFVRFGDVTDEGVKAKGLPLTPENEKNFREEIRKKFGMAAYAIASESRIKAVLQEKNYVVLDGLYSWEEYKYLLNRLPELRLILVFAEKQNRYHRLSIRPIRPLSPDEAQKRDIDEIEKLNKGGPISMADYVIINNGTEQEFVEEIDKMLERLQIKI